MKKRIRFPFVVSGLLFVCAASAQTSFVAGPVDSISSDSNQIVVLGQKYLIDTQTVFATKSKNFPGFMAVRTLTPGSFVAIESQAPHRASLIRLSVLPYVSGATPVIVAGKAEKFVPELGVFRVGGLAIDVSAISPELLAGLQNGSLVEVSGKQPLPQGLLLADGIVVTPSEPTAILESIGGTGSNASSQSIGGTGKGASLQSIGGTGSNASSQSIGGTGKGASLQSIGGTGSNVSLQSIGGTGKGTSLQSIGGTGSNSSLQSIGGTGKSVSPQSIGGTGSSVSLQSIGGTGGNASLQSIGGTGKNVSLQSIGGTGSNASLQSIGGTGKIAALDSIGGTGSSVQ